AVRTSRPLRLAIAVTLSMLIALAFKGWPLPTIKLWQLSGVPMSKMQSFSAMVDFWRPSACDGERVDGYRFLLNPHHELETIGERSVQGGFSRTTATAPNGEGRQQARPLIDEWGQIWLITLVLERVLLVHIRACPLTHRSSDRRPTRFAGKSLVVAEAAKSP